jgi:hypothetical protein
VLAGDARAGVGDVDPQPARPARRPADRDAAAVPVVLDAVANEVEQDLLEPLPIGEHVLLGRLGRADEEAHAALGGKRPNQVHDLADDCAHAHRLG